MKQKFSLLILGVVIGAIVVYAATVERIAPAQQDTKKLQIVTSFYPLYYFTKEIAGDAADVHNITPAGAEPHDYEPTTQDIARVEDSDMVVLNGNLEPWAERLTRDLVKKNIAIISITDGLLLEDFADEDGETVKDPHVWLSPRLAKEIVQTLTEKIARKDPARTETYRANALALQEKLEALDVKFKNGLGKCKQKAFVTSHTAFGYLAGAYGLTQIGITGVSPDAEPTAQELGEVTEFVKREKIKYIFFESLVSSKLAETLAKEVGAKTLVLNPIEGLTPEEVAQGKNYFTEMEKNLENLRTALNCK